MRDDQLVADYLKRLRRATRTMPGARRRELLDEIAAHIAEAQASGVVPLQRVLDDLGDPKDIAATGSARKPLGVREIAAVILLLIGGFIFLAGWVVGLVLLWASPRWRWPDKLLGTLVWPFGYVGALYGLLAGAFTNAANNSGSFCGYGCTSTSTSQGGGMPQWLGALILVAGPDLVAVVASRLPCTRHPRAPHSAARRSSTVRSGMFLVSAAARRNSSAASPSRPSRASRSPRTLGR
jgi:hypothetical protein